MVISYKLLVKAITNSLQIYEKILFLYLKLIFFKVCYYFGNNQTTNMKLRLCGLVPKF